jgi:hypothetical protein
MSETEDPEARRRKRIGRAMVIGFGVLLLAYVLVTFIR